MANEARVRDWKPYAEPIARSAWLERHTEPGKYRWGKLDTPRFTEVESAVEASRPLMDLPEDWDDEGAKPITQATWELAARVLRGAALTAHRRYRFALPAPQIGPCRDGSIDLYWTANTFTLLMNVKPGDVSDFYGERVDLPGAKVQGPFRPDDPDFEFLRLLVRP